MRRVTATALRADVYRILDEILATGEGVEIERDGEIIELVPRDRPSKLDRIVPHPDHIVGDPMDLVHIDWSSEWKPFL